MTNQINELKSGYVKLVIDQLEKNMISTSEEHCDICHKHSQFH